MYPIHYARNTALNYEAVLYQKETLQWMGSYLYHSLPLDNLSSLKKFKTRFTACNTYVYYACYLSFTGSMYHFKCPANMQFNSICDLAYSLLLISYEDTGYFCCSSHFNLNSGTL